MKFQKLSQSRNFQAMFVVFGRSRVLLQGLKSLLEQMMSSLNFQLQESRAGLQDSQMRSLRNLWSSTTWQCQETSKRQLLCMQPFTMYSIGIPRRNLSKQLSWAWITLDATAVRHVFLACLSQSMSKSRSIVRWMLHLPTLRIVKP